MNFKKKITENIWTYIMQKFSYKVASILCIALILCSCTSRIAGFSTIIPDKIDVPKNLNIYKLPSKEVVAVNTTRLYFIIPDRIVRINKLVEKALEEGNGNAIINVKIYRSYMWFLLYGWIDYELTGDVINIPQNTGKI